MKKFNILFLCTHNSARSVLAEALASRHPSQRFQGYSAGSMPSHKVNPIAAALAQDLGFPAEELRSKSWDEFSLPNAPTMDFIITVCDNAAGEVCPLWPGTPVSAHWGFPDPSLVQGSEADKRRAFIGVMNGIKKRLNSLAALPLERLDSMSLQRQLKEIHRLS